MGRRIAPWLVAPIPCVSLRTPRLRRLYFTVCCDMVTGGENFFYMAVLKLGKSRGGRGVLRVFSRWVFAKAIPKIEAQSAHNSGSCLVWVLSPPLSILCWR
ncbi:hypothetical protein LX36DRAFT_661051 [Colletotrichum falcatum]|nr:hypothetical protein LX36DRAFT_661051 [Colletotrichum falcatum]